MDAVKFIKEKLRMCKSNEYCRDCKLSSQQNEARMDCGIYIDCPYILGYEEHKCCCDGKRKIEREEVLKAIRTIKECCEQVSNDDCGTSGCVISDWCGKDRAHVPERWEEGDKHE